MRPRVQFASGATPPLMHTFPFTVCLITRAHQDPLGPAAVQQQQQQLGDAEGSREYSYIFAAPDDANVAEMKRLEKHGGKGKGKGKGKGDYGVDAEQVPRYIRMRVPNVCAP